MKIKILPINILIFLALASSNMFAQNGGENAFGKCVIACPDTLLVEAESDSTYIIPDFFLSGDIVYASSCEFETTTQSPEMGTIVTSFADVFLNYTIGGVSDECNFTLVLETSLGIQKNQRIDFVMYPNPALSNVSLQTAEPIEQVQLYDITGKLVMETDQDQIDVSELSKGLYFVQISTTAGRASKRLVVK